MFNSRAILTGIEESIESNHREYIDDVKASSFLGFMTGASIGISLAFYLKLAEHVSDVNFGMASLFLPLILGSAGTLLFPSHLNNPRNYLRRYIHEEDAQEIELQSIESSEALSSTENEEDQVSNDQGADSEETRSFSI